ncbi:hypothetical protein [Luteolibacter sp. Populi]|uniref:hypothetical protein n=1 Tax=Luteolibacter sp. Populi TaxID=3230487 RepID=UPI003467DDEA
MKPAAERRTMGRIGLPDDETLMGTDAGSKRASAGNLRRTPTMSNDDIEQFEDDFVISASQVETTVDFQVAPVTYPPYVVDLNGSFRPRRGVAVHAVLMA